MKRFFAALFAAIICCTYGLPSFAISYSQQEEVLSPFVDKLVRDIDYRKEIANALTGTIDNSVDQEVLNRIHVNCSNPNAEVFFTVSHTGSVQPHTMSEAKNVYTVTAATKTTTGTSTEDYVDCWISITWIDNFGTNNELVSVAGGWTPNERTLSNRDVFYGICNIHGTFLDGLSEHYSPSYNSYYYVATKSLVGTTMQAYSWVTSSGYPYRILCEVWPSIFD